MADLQALQALSGVCELLHAVQNPEATVRQAGEKQLEEALKSSPSELVRQLTAVLALRDQGGAPVELRQEAAVLLRQCIAGAGARLPVWSDLDSATQAGLKGQLLLAMQHDSSAPVRRNAGSAAASIADLVAEDFDDLQREWPELLPALSRLVSPDIDAGVRVTALGVLKELSATAGEGLMAQGPQVIAMLQACLGDASPGVRAAAAQLVLQFIEDLEEEQAAQLAPVMGSVIGVLQVLASSASHEELLKETLESLISAADEEPEFFKANGLQQLWPFLLQLCGVQHFADEDVRHSAMEAAMSFAVGLAEDFCKSDGQVLLEQVIAANIEWMLEVEEDVDAWNKQADADDDDDIDGDAVQIGEENMDRLAEKYADEKQLEEVFLPLMFKVIRAALQSPAATWKHTRSAVMAVSQVVEHIEEEAWIDQCVEFISQHLNHPHPRVRYSAFQAVGQVAYDHEPYVQETHHGTLLPAIVAGLDDANVRVATNAANAFVSLGEELDREDLEPYLDDLMTKLFTRLQQGQTRTMQEQCLAGIAVVGEVAEELFVPYYKHVMPVLKDIISKSSAENQRVLRGKAFECVSLIGDAVGKETFRADAHDVMQVMMQFVQAGFAADDPTREYILEACGRIASTLERDFKPFVPALLPGLFTILSQRPQEVDPASLPDDDDDDEKDDMSLLLVGEKVLGLKTSVLDEMKESLTLVITLVQALEDDYCEFLPATCQNLLPLLDFALSEDLREKAFRAWEVMTECARNSVERGKCDKTVLRELVQEFLKRTIALMGQTPEGDKLDVAALSALQAQATGMSDVIRKAGKDVLSKEDVSGMVAVLVQLLARVGSSEAAEPVSKRKHKKDEMQGDDDKDKDDDTDSDEEEVAATRQSVRFCLADIAGSLMKSNRMEFVEVGLPTFMEMVKVLVQPTASEGDRSLALYIADDVVDCLAEHSIPYWNLFMEQACRSITDKCPEVRQYASSIIGHASRQPIFAQIAPLAASQLARVLQKHGERHRRRRAVKSEAKQMALAVDASIRALGQICENQEQNIGGDSVSAWRLWLSSLPLRYDHDEGQKAHAQLLELVVRGHPVVTSPEFLPRVMAVFADVYRSRFSNGVLDKEIAAAVARAGAGPVQQIAAGLPEKQRKKVEQMLKDGQAA